MVALEVVDTTTLPSSCLSIGHEAWAKRLKLAFDHVDSP
jgi:hypothetical protein